MFCCCCDKFKYFINCEYFVTVERRKKLPRRWKVLLMRKVGSKWLVWVRTKLPHRVLSRRTNAQSRSWRNGNEKRFNSLSVVIYSDADCRFARNCWVTCCACCCCCCCHLCPTTTLRLMAISKTTWKTGTRMPPFLILLEQGWWRWRWQLEPKDVQRSNQIITTSKPTPDFL